MNNSLEKFVTPDMECRIRRLKRNRIFFIALAPLGFIMFGVGGFLCTITVYCIPIPIVGFFMFPTSFLCAIMLTTKISCIRSIMDIVNNVKLQDKVFLYQINANPTQELQTIATLKKLIELGYLEGYELVGNIMIAKQTLHVSVEDAMNEYSLLRFGKTVNAQDDNGVSPSMEQYVPFSSNGNSVDNTEKECYYCHAKVSADAVYCSKCGARLNY